MGRDPVSEWSVSVNWAIAPTGVRVCAEAASVAYRGIQMNMRHVVRKATLCLLLVLLMSVGLPARSVFAQEASHKPVTGELITLLEENPEIKNLLEQSIAAAKKINRIPRRIRCRTWRTTSTSSTSPPSSCPKTQSRTRPASKCATRCCRASVTRTSSLTSPCPSSRTKVSTETRCSTMSPSPHGCGATPRPTANTWIRRTRGARKSTRASMTRLNSVCRQTGMRRHPTGRPSTSSSPST